MYLGYVNLIIWNFNCDNLTGTIIVFEMYEELGDLGYGPCSATVCSSVPVMMCQIQF